MPCCRCRLSLIFRWQHWTRTLPAVEPITAAMSEAVFPWATNPRIVLMAFGVKTRRAPCRNPPLGATGPMFKLPAIDLLVAMAPCSCPSRSRTGPRHPQATARSCAGFSSFGLAGRSSIRVSMTYRDTDHFRKPLIFCVCGMRTFRGGALRQVNVKLPLVGSETKPAKPRGEQSPAPTGLIGLFLRFAASFD
jgi:hypothetical protein